MVMTPTIEACQNGGIALDPRLFNLRAIGSETRVDTQDGPTPASWLSEGQKVRTLGDGLEALVRVRQIHLSAEDLRRYPWATPVLLRAGCFRPGVPRQNLLLSPEQTVWSGSKENAPGRFGSAQVFTDDPLQFQGQELSVSYVALDFERPTFVRAEGVCISC